MTFATVHPGARQPTAGRAKPRLLAVGFHVPATGLTRVMASMLAPLASRYEIHHIGLGYKGPVIDGDITLYPCNLRGGDVFGVAQAREFVERCRPELVLLVNDLWIVAKYPKALAPFADRARLVSYCPLDGRIVDAGLLAPLATLDRLVVYTEFARREVARAAATLSEVGGNRFPALGVIPHGVDTAAFFPQSGSVERQLRPDGRLAARRRLLPHAPDLEGSFVVLNANRPQPRKRIDLTLEGFALFARDKPANVRLVLHHAIATAEERDALARQTEALGIAARVAISPPSGRGVTDAELNLIYNACDVGLNTAMGEGWGLVSFEHAATGAAQILPRHSACAELWRGAAELVEPVETSVPPFSLLELAAVSPAGVAAALERLYADRAHRRALSLAAYRTATQPAYRWNHIADRWDDLFSDLLATHPVPPSAETALAGREPGR